jgi:hypothetical protein
MRIILNILHFKYLKMNTKLCIPTKINIQKRYGGGAGGGDKIGKIVKETGKIVAPKINEAVTAASKTEGQKDSQEKEKGTPAESKTKSQEQPSKAQASAEKSQAIVKNRPQKQPTFDKKRTQSYEKKYRSLKQQLEEQQQKQQLREQKQEQEGEEQKPQPVENDSSVQKSATKEEELPTITPTMMEAALRKEYTFKMLSKQNAHGFLDSTDSTDLLKKIINKDFPNIELSQELKKVLENTEDLKSIFNAETQDSFVEYLLKSLTEKNIKFTTEDLKKYLEHIKKTDNISVKEEQFCENLEAYLSETLKKMIVNNIESKRLFTKEDHLLEIDKFSQIKTQMEKSEISAIEMFDCFYKTGIIKYPNVYHKGAYLIEDPTVKSEKYIYHEEKMIFKNGEGPKIPHKTYNLLLQYLQEKSTNEKPTMQDLNAIKDAIKQGKFYAGIYNDNSNNKDTQILTGLDNHISLFVEAPNKPGFVFLIGFFTSANDPDTVQLSSRQEFNADSLEAKKVQKFRVAKAGICVKKEHVTDHEDATKFAHGVNRDNENVHDKLILLTEKALESWLNHKILDNITVDFTFLRNLALKTLDQKIMELKNIIKKKEGMTIEKQEKDEEKAKAQKENHLQEQKVQQKMDSLSPIDNLLFRIKEELKAKIKKKRNVNASDEHNVIASDINDKETS